MNEPKPLRWGVAGLGRAFTVMLPTLVADPRVRLVAASDPRDDARAQFEADFGASTYRDAESLCRIEVAPETIARVVENREDIVESLKSLGYTYVTLDLQGFRSGSMNETLDDETKESKL